MRTVRQVIVFDAADLSTESAFWAGMVAGRVFEDTTWHTVVDEAGQWRIGVQLKTDHVPPDWSVPAVPDSRSGCVVGYLCERAIS